MRRGIGGGTGAVSACEWQQLGAGAVLSAGGTQSGASRRPARGACPVSGPACGALSQPSGHRLVPYSGAPCPVPAYSVLYRPVACSSNA